MILLRCISTALAYQDPDMDTHIQIWIWICPSSRWIALWPLNRKLENQCKFCSNFATNLHIAFHSTPLLATNVSSYVLRFYVRIQPTTAACFFVRAFLRTYTPNQHITFLRTYTPSHHITFLRTFFNTQLNTFLRTYVSSYVLFASL